MLKLWRGTISFRKSALAKSKAQSPKLQDYLHAGLFIFLSSAVGVGAVMIVQYLGASGQSMWW